MPTGTIQLNPVKCAFYVTSGTLLNHIVSREGIAMDFDKVHAILNVPAPTTTKALSCFLGQIRWHCRMLRYLADFATPLHVAVHTIPFRWTEREDEAYRSLKVMLSHAPVVQPRNWLQPFHVFVDASDIAIGSVLMQKTSPNWYRPVYYASRRLSTAKKNYSTIEHEALGMIYSITKFFHYLLGRKFTFQVDHSTLLYLVNKQSLTGRLARWLLILQELDFDIQHRPGVQHAVADYLSRLESKEPIETEYDDLLDASLFTVDTTTLLGDHEDAWIMDMTHFLGTGIPPKHLTLDAKN